MIASDPLEQLSADRQAAREQSDPWAALCVVGTLKTGLEASERVELRTLVLRDLEGKLALFFSATSPKWRQLEATESVALLVYLPSLEVQYRLQANWQPIPAATVHKHWQLRPDIPKRLDWLYELHPQSTALERTKLTAALADDTRDEPPSTAPAGAMGIVIEPFEVERLQLSKGIHERYLFTRLASSWTQQSLVP